MLRTTLTMGLAVCVLGFGSAQTVELHRFATVPLGAEITGLFVSGGDLFFNVQHPAASNSGINRGTVGVVHAADFRKRIGLPAGEARQTVTVAGGHYQVLGQSGKRGLGEITTVAGQLMLVSNNPDFNAFVPTNKDATQGLLFTNWEERPGGMSRMAIQKEGTLWTTQAIEMLDFSRVHGTWINCFGTLSPWGTPISSEELYFDETRDWYDPGFSARRHTVLAMERYLGKPGNPYRMGWNVEITDPAGTATPIKRTAMGRFSHENVAVMNDHRTVYQSDDGSDVVFFKFIADQPADLRAGTLFAAKVTQNSDDSFTLRWVRLAHATQAQVDRWIGEYDAGGYLSDRDVAIWAVGQATDDRVAFLESRKAAKAKGATAEFRKMEGVLADPEGRYLYLAMSEVGHGMADGKGDIQVAENRCGIVYRLPLDGQFDVQAMQPWVVGGPYDDATRTCSTENIANPDNVLPMGNGLVLIGEDTPYHDNNMLWVAR